MMLRIIALVLLLVGFAVAYRNAQPDRDPRCDTPARYQAMSEGANCS